MKKIFHCLLVTKFIQQKSLTLLAFFLYLGWALPVTMAETNTKSVNVWGDVGGLLYHAINAGADLKIAGPITIGPAMTRLKVSSLGTSLTANGYGGYLRAYLTDAISSGFRISAFYYSIPMKITAGAFSGSFSTYEYGGLFGYHFVPGIFNFAVDLGYGYYSAAGKVTLADSTGTKVTVATPSFSGAMLLAQITLGIAF